MEANVAQRDDILVWIDLEMTGLDPKTCRIIELAMILTDREFQMIANPLEIAIWQPESVLDGMSPFVRAMHTRSGLIDKVRQSQVDEVGAQTQTMGVLTEICRYRTALLAGNSVWQDARFLRNYMPAITDYLHYRIIDVSGIKELAGCWYGVRYEKPPGAKHTAMFDIQQSIAELKFYRDKVMI
jgi:oligoribonuclease